MNFSVTAAAIDVEGIRGTLASAADGALVLFEGRVRNHHEGRKVLRLEYEVYAPLALKEGERIIAEAGRLFGPVSALCIHRYGKLELQDVAVAVAVSSAHRDEAFRACRYIIDEIKLRLPIWKKEHYADGHSEWVNCARCARHEHTA